MKRQVIRNSKISNKRDHGNSTYERSRCWNMNVTVNVIFSVLIRVIIIMIAMTIVITTEEEKEEEEEQWERVVTGIRMNERWYDTMYHDKQKEIRI